MSNIAPSEYYGLNQSVITRINDVLKSHPNIENAIIYGSRAKGNHRPNSDIDLCLVGEKLTLTELFSIENQLDELLLPYKIDLSLYHTIDNPLLIEHINRVGVTFAKKK